MWCRHIFASFKILPTQPNKDHIFETVHTQSPTSNEILIDQNPLDWVLTLEQNLSIINMAHELGLGVMLSPMIGFMHEDTWYEAYNITPSDPTAWLKSYQEFAVFYARLADEHDVEIFNLGGGTYQFHGNNQGWKEVLEDIRSVYSGTVAYPERIQYRQHASTAATNIK